MKRRQVFFILALIIATAATAVSYATTSGTTTLAVTGSTSSASVTPATAGTIVNGKNSGTNPAWSPVANSTGSITAGDLYIVDLSDFGSAEDKRLTLYLNNPDLLSEAYSYLNMNITVYEADNAAAPTAWPASTITPNNAYLTLTNGYISFDLEGGKKYSISVDNGSFFCMTTTGVTLAPSFFAELR
jgi:hypothetical protein